jgi:hypothetical protein
MTFAKNTMRAGRNNRATRDKGPADRLDKAGTGRYNPAPYRMAVRAVSSAVEHHVDIVGVTGSIPVSPTIRSDFPKVGLCLRHYAEIFP